MWKRMVDYFEASYGELKKVSWPKKDDVIGSTIVVIVFIIILAMMLGIIDVTVSSVVQLILGGETPFDDIFSNLFD